MGRTYKDLRRHGREPRQPQNLGRCGNMGKRIFASEESAAETGERIMASDHNNATMMRPYLCEWCKKWHLTSRPHRFPPA